MLRLQADRPEENLMEHMHWCSEPEDCDEEAEDCDGCGKPTPGCRLRRTAMGSPGRFECPECRGASVKDDEES